MGAIETNNALKEVLELTDEQLYLLRQHGKTRQIREAAETVSIYRQKLDDANAKLARLLAEVAE